MGVQIKRGTAVTITHSRLINNARAGLLDMSPARGTTLRESLVSANGHDGERYNGDGVELNSTGATVTGNTITHNGDGVGFEHGIYAGATANDYTITGQHDRRQRGRRRQGRRAARGWLPTTGSPRALRRRALGQPGGRDGAVQPHPGPLPARRPAHDGPHARARAALEQHRASRPAARRRSGNASAVFVASAAQLELRNNLLAYTNPTRSERRS